jgi:hypothetical protein
VLWTSLSASDALIASVPAAAPAAIATEPPNVCAVILPISDASSEILLEFFEVMVALFAYASTVL